MKSQSIKLVNVNLQPDKTSLRMVFSWTIASNSKITTALVIDKKEASKVMMMKMKKVWSQAVRTRFTSFAGKIVGIGYQLT